MEGRKYCFFIFLLMFLCNSICKSVIQNNQFERLNTSQLTKFVSYYYNHSFVIHNVALGVVNIAELLDMLPSYHMVGENNTFIKPVAKNTINIFFIQNVSEIGSFSHTFRVFNEDGGNLFVTNEILENVCSSESVNLAPASFVFNIRNNQLFSCFTEDEELNSTLISEEQFDNLQIYHRSFRDLGGKIMKIYFLNNQATLCRTIVNGYVTLVTEGKCNPTGAEANLVRTLGKKFNFTPEFWLFPHRNAITVWDEMIDAIGRGEADFGAGSIVIGEDGIVHYTTSTHISAEFVVLYVNPTKELNLWKILFGFDFIVYVIALSSLILIVILTIFFTYHLNYPTKSVQLIFIFLKMIVEQGSNFTDGLYSFITIKLVIFIWLYFTIIFCSVLKSKIASILIQPETYDCRTIEDLSRADFTFTVKESLQKKFLAKYGWIGIKTIGINPLNFEDVRELCPATMYFFRYRYAVVHSEFDLLVGLKMCVRYFPSDKVNDLRFFTESNIYHALAMNPRSPYRKQFTLNIDQLKSSGIMTNWYDYVSRSVLTQLSKERNLPRPFAIDQVLNFFILLLVGLGIGCLVLILEIIESVLVRRYNFNITIMDKL